MHLRLISPWLAAATLSLACALSAVAQTGGGATLADALGNAPLAGTIIPAKGQVFTVGHATFTFAEGAFHPFKTDAGLTAMYFKGSGTLNYVSTDPVEASAFKYNLENNTGYKAEKTDKGLRVTRPFNQATLWLVGAELPGLTPAAPSDSPEKLGAALAQFRASFSLYGSESYEWTNNPRGGSVLDSLARHLRNTPNKPYVVVEMSSPTVPNAMIFRHDPTWDQSDLLALEKNTRWITLSRQLIGCSYQAPADPKLVLTHVDIALTTSKTSFAKLTVKEQFSPQIEGIKSLILNLWNFQPDNRIEKKACDIRLLSVKDASGNAVSFRHKNKELFLEFPTALDTTKPTELTFDIEGDMLYIPQATTYWNLGCWAWFPQPDFSEQFYTVHAVLKVPAPYVPILPGKMVHRKEGDMQVCETTIDKPVRDFVADAGSYVVQEKAQGERTVRVWSYTNSDIRPAYLLEATHAVIDNLADVLQTPFPWKEINIIEKPMQIHEDTADFSSNTGPWLCRATAGHAIPVTGYVTPIARLYPPATLYVGKWSYDSVTRKNKGSLLEQSINGINFRLARGLAAQYWAQYVKPFAPEDQWISESLSVYLSALLAPPSGMEKELDVEQRLKTLKNIWRNQASDELSRGMALPTAHWLHNHTTSDATNDRVLRDITFGRGALVFAELNDKVGDVNFQRLCKGVLKRCEWGPLTVGMFQDAVRQLMQDTKGDYKAFFDRYYWGTEPIK